MQACPSGALEFIREENGDTGSAKSREGTEALHPEYKTEPRVYYKNLYRYFRCFVAGSVSFQKEGVTECAEGAKVELWKDSEQVQVQVTDAFGDFKIDNLEEDSGPYRIEISYKDYAKKEVKVDLKESVNLGEISL